MLIQIVTEIGCYFLGVPRARAHNTHVTRVCASARECILIPDIVYIYKLSIRYVLINIYICNISSNNYTT